ncbi:MAG: fluoride efflux transporter CrcB [Clostridiaceae bacterium]
MDYLLVAVGGAFGSITRFVIGRRITEKSRTNFPIGTFLINISGAFLLGVVSSFGLNSNISMFIGTGFLGAFTTFSTFMYEGFNLFQDNEKLNALGYIFGSLILGIIGFVVGIEAANLIKSI